jgi:hypothetical protein
MTLALPLLLAAKFCRIATGSCRFVQPQMYRTVSSYSLRGIGGPCLGSYRCPAASMRQTLLLNASPWLTSGPDPFSQYVALLIVAEPLAHCCLHACKDWRWS